METKSQTRARKSAVKRSAERRKTPAKIETRRDRAAATQQGTVSVGKPHTVAKAAQGLKSLKAAHTVVAAKPAAPKKVTKAKTPAKAPVATRRSRPRVSQLEYKKQPASADASDFLRDDNDEELSPGTVTLIKLIILGLAVLLVGLGIVIGKLWR